MAIGDELASLDFESMIGGPLNAVIKAQAQSAVTSVDFIKAVGFDTDEQGNVSGPTMVTFKYMKPVVNMKSFQNLKYAAKDYLNRFIIKN